MIDPVLLGGGGKRINRAAELVHETMVRQRLVCVAKVAQISCGTYFQQVDTS